SKLGRKKGDHEPRFAFMTKSIDVDLLEDGYRWRKYGQKAVKNSRYPRNYYRCTNTNCCVKKRVERSCEDPSMVITTYEGRHSHHSPALVLPRSQLPHVFRAPIHANAHANANAYSTHHHIIPPSSHSACTIDQVRAATILLLSKLVQFEACTRRHDFLVPIASSIPRAGQ
ncbi:hypothetical protein KI387_023819, partial [Taxus chinensis]